MNKFGVWLHPPAPHVPEAVGVQGQWGSGPRQLVWSSACLGGTWRQECVLVLGVGALPNFRTR